MILIPKKVRTGRLYSTLRWRSTSTESRTIMKAGDWKINADDIRRIDTLVTGFDKEQQIFKIRNNNITDIGGAESVCFYLRNSDFKLRKINAENSKKTQQLWFLTLKKIS